MLSRDTANVLWLALLMSSAFSGKVNTTGTEILGNNQDSVSTVVASGPVVARQSLDIYPDVVLKGLIVVKIKKVSYIRELSDREKILTKRLVALCEREMNKLFQSIKGKQTAKIESFRRGRWSTTIVLMNLDSTGNGNVSEINEVINKKIKIPGKFINYDVERRMVRFLSYGVCCQPKVHYSFGSISRGAVYDTSGFDNNGILHGPSESYNRGKYGRAIKFQNGYISLKSFKKPKAPTGTSSIAVIFWIRILNPRANSIIFRCYYNGSVVQLSLERGLLKWQFIARDETTAFQLKHKRLLRPRYWTHVAGIYDAYTGTAKLYVDAKVEAQSTVRTNAVKWRFESSMRFGLMSSEGFLDELYVYDCVLGEDIIKNIRENRLRKEKCSPRGKNEYLIRIILVSTNNSRSSNDEITELVESEIEKMFDGISGEQKVQFIGYRPADGNSIMVDYSLRSTGNSDAKYLAGVLQPAITSGKIGGVNLASNDVYFVAISGKSVCLSSEMKCNDGQCINKLWKCDGEINCADGSDEVNCGKTIDMNCNENEYQCKTPRILGINDCVNGDFRCDGQLDCHDDSDEHSCVPPRLITAPRSLIVLAEGETASCTCAASGVPVPKVSWRYRGKKVLSKEGKISVTSVSGRGTLTIFNVAYADSGDYICKVMDNRVTKIIAPSCTITVRAFGKVCSQPYFNSVAQRSSDCLRCFCHEKTDRCRSARLYRSTISSRWGCATCKDEPPSLVDENGQTLRSLTERENLGAATSYYWQLPKKYVGNKLASYGGRLRFKRNSESLQGGPARIRRSPEESGGNHEREPNGRRIHPTVGNYVFETDHNGFWFNRRNRKPHANDVPSVKGPPTHKHDFDGDDVMSGPRMLNLTRQNVAVIVGKDGTQLFSTKPLYLNDRSVEIRINEESWKELGKVKTTSRTKLMRVLTDVEHIFINARDPEASTSSLISVSLDTAVKQEHENEELTLVERCACPLGYEGLSCEKCTGEYFRSKQTNRCVKCRCFNHSTTCNPNTGECENCLHGTEGPNCQDCKDGSYGDATIGTANDCKPCACPLEGSTNQFSKLCYLHVDGEQTCSQCHKGYTGRNCERCAEGYEGNPLVVGGNCYKVGNFSRCDLSGSVSQNVTKRGEITCTCKTNVVGSTCDQCRSGTFNLQVSNPSGCERCFCSRATHVCSNLIGSRITIKTDFKNDRFLLMTFDRTISVAHTVGNLNGEAYLRTVFPKGHNINKVLYWNLPFKFTGSKVASYGGYLEYTVSYTWSDSNKLPRAHDVMFLGKQFGMIYAGRNKEYVNKGRQTYRVSLKEKFWRFSSRTMVSKHVFMLFLGKIERVLILATPKIKTTETRLHDVKLDIAVENKDGSGKPLYSLEKCSCPAGYLGYSCEDCADGFARAGSQIYSRCVKCQCNGHSSRCDKITGECKNCQHNTGGKHCEKCNPGFYGDATTGSEAACRPCPCPQIRPPNRFSPTCYMGDDGQPVCDRCAEGHEGVRCERCKEPYTGNPLVNGDSCKPVTSCGCDPKGSRSKECDPKTKRCICKKNVQGEKCHKCKRGFYNMQKDNEEGCTKCFCMGFNTACRSRNYFREQIHFAVHSTTLPAGLTIATEDLSEHSTDFVVDMLRKRVRFFNTTWLQKGNIYWTLPPRFLGNQVTSYGGALRFSLSFALPSHGISDIGSTVRIKGSGVTLHYRHLERFRANIANDEKIVFLEKHWAKPDGGTVSRTDLMKVLVNIDAIMIRASYSQRAFGTSIADIKMNVYPNPGQTKAADVEMCDCPFTYHGTSCESCSRGYTRRRRPFGQCVRCQCNVHSAECDEYTGVCKKCQDNTVGDNCERCTPGFYGDATKGSAKDCKECPCPLPGSSNRFSDTCFLDKDGLPTCDSCQEGYSGRNCEKCSLNYTGNPLTPGGKCFQVPVELIPKVKITPESITLQEGDSARFVCHVTTVRPTQVLWSRENWLQLSSRATVNGNILSFKSLNMSDAGDYVCTASNDIAVRTAKMRLTVKKQQISAVFVTVSPKSRYIPIGGTAKFSCTSKTSSRYSIKWTREHNKAMSVTTSVVDGTLTVTDAKLQDGGTYICTGKNALNIDRAIVSLHVGVVVKPQVSASPQRQVVAIAEAVTFRCSATGFPAATLRWQREDGRQLPRFIKFLRTVGLFKISAASREDEGEYTCTASNSGGDSVMKVQLLVKGPNSLPKASITPSSFTTEEGKRADFYCQISGDEKLHVRWIKRNGRLPESAVIIGNRLEIEKTSLHDQGVYTCTVANRYGQAEASTRLTVKKDKSSPKVVIRPGGAVISVMEGRSLTLVCYVTGISNHSIQWKRLLKTGYIGDGAKLHLKNIQADDTGVYECSVKSDKDEEKASVSVIVQRTAVLPRVQVTPNEISVQRGGKANFVCRTSSQLPVTITWSREDGSPLGRNHATRQNRLVIRDVTKGDGGTYICLARNRFGASKATAELAVLKS